MHPCRIHFMWEVELARAMQDPSSFILCLPGVSQSPFPLRAVVQRSPLGQSIKTFSRGSFSSPQSFAGSKTWVSSTTHGQRITFRGQSLHLIQWMRSKWWDHLRANPGLGYSDSSFSSRLSLSSENLYYKENFPQSAHKVGMVWVSTARLALD